MQAIVLCGGKGERLRPYTNNRPKGMVLVNDKPLLEFHLEWLKKNGVTEVTFACGYLHEVIEDHFKDGSSFGVKANYSIEDEPLGRGGALKKAWKLSDSTDPIFVTNGDIYSEINLSNVYSVHKQKNVKVSMCLFPFRCQYGVVYFDGDSYIEKFEEKPILPYWINGGIYVLDPSIKDDLPDKGDHETTVFPDLASKKKMYAYKSSDYWKGVDTVKDLTEFSQHMAK